MMLLNVTSNSDKKWIPQASKSTPDRRFMKSHTNLKDVSSGTAKSLKVNGL